MTARILALVVTLAVLVAFASASVLAPAAAPAAAAAPPAKAPALIRMWTGAKPCAQTQQYFGSYLNGLAGRMLNVDHGYSGMGKFTAALKPYASGVRLQAGGAAVKSLTAAAQALRTYAKANAAVVTGLFGQCATNLGGMAENNAQASVTQLPAGAAAAGGGYVAGGIKPGAIAAHACPELCAFAVALTTPKGKAPTRSCSVAVARGTGKANPVMRIAVSGGAVAQPKLLVSPANVNIPYPGAAAPVAGAVAWVNAPVAAGAPNYDSCTINPAGCAPAAYAGGVDANSGYSPALEAVWQAQIAAGGHYANPDPLGAAAPGPRAASIGNQGGCSEDKLVSDFISAAATVE